MKNSIKTLCVAGSLIVAASAGAETFNATATVSNAITLTETTPFDLGSMFIAADGTNVATYTCVPSTLVCTPTTAGGTSKIIALSSPTFGVVSVTGAAPFADVTIVHDPTTPTTDLIHSSGNPSLAVIEFTTLVTLPADAGTLTLDGAGDGDIIIGGTFDTEAAATAYTDGSYTGSYTLTVTY